MIEQPTGEEVKQARTDANLSRAEAAAMIWLSHFTRVGEIERNEQPIDMARWELLQMKLGIHPDFEPLKPRKR